MTAICLPIYLLVTVICQPKKRHDLKSKIIRFLPSLVCNLDPVPFDCQEAYVLGCRRSGVYTIDPGCGKSFSVWCDMNNGGGWTVFQRRRDGSENFYRGWTQYEHGFGNVKGEHWLGLKKISCLTGARPVAQLRVDLANYGGHRKYAQYRYFLIDSASTNYKLTVGGYSGTAGDSLTGRYSLNGRQFTTYDRDNDAWSSGNCAVSEQGAWWYGYCSHSNLNGKYLRGVVNCDGVFWLPFNTPSNCYSLKWSEMKLRLVWSMNSKVLAQHFINLTLHSTSIASNIFHYNLVCFLQ